MTPSLSLEYHPGLGQEFMASGWTLGGLSSIARCPKTLAHEHEIDPVHFTNDDNYCLDGKRLVAIGNVTDGVEYRTQPDSFVRVIGHDGASGGASGHESFELITPDGTHKYYGEATNFNAHVWSDKLDAQQRQIAFAWLIDHEASSATPATIDYVYTNATTSAGTSAYAPDRIGYSGRTIAFTTENPLTTDPRFGWTGYRFVTNTALLSTIQATAPGAPSHTYTLGYAQGPRTGRTLLTDIKESVDGALGATRSIAHFEWNSSPGATSHFTEVPTSLISPWDPIDASVELMDVTCDGLPDYVATDFIAGQDAPITYIAAAGGPSIFGTPQEQPWPGGQVGAHSVDRGVATDLNQDGFDDLLRYNYDKPDGNWQALIAEHPTSTTTSFNQVDTGINRLFTGTVPQWLVSQSATAHLADLNGDGVPDLIQCWSGEDWRTLNHWTVNYWVPTGAPAPNGSGFEGGPGTAIDALQHYPCDVVLHVADIDGDHRAQLIVPHLKLIDVSGVLTWDSYESPYLAYGERADGSWVGVDTQVPLPPDGLTQWTDINGDGLPDAVQAESDPNMLDNLDVFFNTGSQFTGPYPALSAEMANIATSIDAAIPIDFNADGRQDLLIPQFVAQTGVGWQALQATGTLSPVFQPVVIPELVSLPIYATPDNFETQSPAQPGGGNWPSFVPTSAAQPRAADLNADGAPDLLATFPDTGSGPSPVRTYISTFAEEDTLKSVTNGTNAWSSTDPQFVPDVALSYTHLIDSARTAFPGEADPAYEPNLYLSRWDVGSITTAVTATSPALSREDYAYDATEQLASHMLTVGGLVRLRSRQRRHDYLSANEHWCHVQNPKSL